MHFYVSSSYSSHWNNFSTCCKYWATQRLDCTWDAHLFSSPQCFGCNALQHKHVPEKGSCVFLWLRELWLETHFTISPFAVFCGSAWAQPDQCQHQTSTGVSQVNCGAHTAWQGEKKHHRKVTHERKIKRGLPPYATKHSSLPAVGWSIFAVWDRCALWELWEEQWAWHSKSTNGVAAFVLPEEEPKFSCFRFFCGS